MSMHTRNKSSRNRRPSSQTLKFEYILEMVGDDDRHQKMLLYLFLLPLAFYVPLGCSSLMLMLYTPDHMCSVPAREVLNVSLPLWRRITIPRISNADGEEGRYSQCLMKNVTFSEADEEGLTRFRIEPHNNIKCQYGWEYDKQWWDKTATSEHNWVCDNAYIVPMLISLAIISNAVGTLLMNLLADRLGRRPVFFSCVLISSVFGIVNLFCSTWQTFAVTKFLSSFVFYSMYQLPYLLVVEQSCGKVRGNTAALCSIAMTFGMVAVSLIAWLSRNWRIFGLACYLPGFLFLFYWRLLPESPRWLLTKGRLEECSSVLHLIASRNGRRDPPELMRVLCELRKEEKKNETKSLMGFFKEPAIRKRILITVVNSCILSVAFAGLNFKIRNITRIEFVNFFIFSLVDIPGNLLGMISARFLGRRLTTIYTQFIASVFCFVSSAFATTRVPFTVLCCLGKILITSTTVVAFMQVGELFPTYLRTAAYGLTGSMGLLSTLVLPTLMATGSVYPQIPFYILGILCLIGGSLSSLLPETLGKALPQTLEEANSIGHEQRFFSCITHWNVHKHNRDEQDVCEGDVTSRTFVSDKELRN